MCIPETLESQNIYGPRHQVRAPTLRKLVFSSRSPCLQTLNHTVLGPPHICNSCHVAQLPGVRAIWDSLGKPVGVISGLYWGCMGIMDKKMEATILGYLGFNVAPFLMEGFGLMKSFREIIQNQLLFEGFGIMKSFGDRNKKMADSES